MKQLATLALLATAALAQTPAAKTFDMYFLDMEGGHSTLYITPTGQTILIDTGSAGDRDHSRILAALKDAGVKELDYLVSTHYHGDHIGGFEALLKDIPVKHFIDHGTSIEIDRPVVAAFHHCEAGRQDSIWWSEYAGGHVAFEGPEDAAPRGG